MEAERPSARGLFIAKYTNDGDYVWSVNIGGNTGSFAPGNDAGGDVASLAIAADGSVLVGGDFDGSIDFGHGAASASAAPNAFVGLLSADGSAAPGPWPIVSGDALMSKQYVTSVAVTPTGVLVAAGYFSGMLTLGFPSVDVGAGNMFVATYAPDGTGRWRYNFGNGQATNVASASDGSVFVGGAFTGTMRFRNIGPTLTATANGSAFLFKLDDTGTTAGALWGLSFGDAAGLTGLAVGANDDVHLSGFFVGPTMLAGVSVDPGAGQNALLAKLTKAGGYLWHRGFAPHGTMHLAVDADDDTLLCGRITTSIDLGTGPLAPSDTSAGYVAKFAP